MMNKKEKFRMTLFVLLAIGGIGYFGYSFVKPIKQKPIVLQMTQKKTTPELLTKDFVSAAPIQTDEVKEWMDLFFYFSEKALAITATGVGIALTMKQMKTSKKRNNT